MTKSVLALMLAGVLFTGCKDAAEQPKNVKADTATTVAVGKMETASFEIEGMTCAMGCAKTIENKLTSMDGVSKATVDFEKKTATVAFDSAKQTPEKIVEAVEAVAGGDLYKVKNVKSSGDHAAAFKEKDKDKKKKKSKKAEGKADDKKECAIETTAKGCCAGKKPASCHKEKETM